MSIFKAIGSIVTASKEIKDGVTQELGTIAKITEEKLNTIDADEVAKTIGKTVGTGVGRVSALCLTMREEAQKAVEEAKEAQEAQRPQAPAAKAQTPENKI